MSSWNCAHSTTDSVSSSSSSSSNENSCNGFYTNSMQHLSPEFFQPQPQPKLSLPVANTFKPTKNFIAKNQACMVFVGDLSYFCTERDLQELFSDYSRKVLVQIRHGVDGQSLLHGFVVLDSPEATHQAARELNGTLFMGRNIKVHLSTNHSKVSLENQHCARLHFSFITKQITHTMNEIALRPYFAHFGNIIDISIKKYNIDSKQQSGYGFIFYRTSVEATAAENALSGRSINDVTFDCHCLVPLKHQNLMESLDRSVRTEAPKTSPTSIANHRKRAPLSQHANGLSSFQFSNFQSKPVFNNVPVLNFSIPNEYSARMPCFQEKSIEYSSPFQWKDNFTW